MVMSWIWTGILAISILASLLLGNGAALAAAIPKGSQAGLELALSLAVGIIAITTLTRLLTLLGKKLRKAEFFSHFHNSLCFTVTFRFR